MSGIANVVDKSLLTLSIIIFHLGPISLMSLTNTFTIELLICENVEIYIDLAEAELFEEES